VYKHLLVATDGSRLSGKAVTHAIALAQALKAELTAFYSVEVTDSDRCGVLVEYGATSDIFIRPSDERTEAYVTGRFG